MISSEVRNLAKWQNVSGKHNARQCYIERHKKMSKILGLDLGINSIGWAIIDNSSNKIIDCAVRIFTNSFNNERHLVRQQRRTENKIVQRTFLTKQIRVLLRRTHPIILILCFSSFLTALLIFLNFSNWQFWFNSFLTILLVTLTLLHSDNKK